MFFLDQRKLAHMLDDAARCGERSELAGLALQPVYELLQWMSAALHRALRARASRHSYPPRS